MLRRMRKKPVDFLTRAAKKAARGVRQGDGGPFGAALVKGNKLVALAHNTVLRTNDPTAHAEINAIRQASKKLKRWDLSDCVIFSTTEPCPMCFSAIHWARIGRIVFSTTIADVKALGFNELPLSNVLLKRLGKVKLRVVVRKNAACRRLLRDWVSSGGLNTY